MKSTPSHAWRFTRMGGFDQVSLSGADYPHLDQLDQKLWVALACPARGLEFDAKTLELIDTDQDNRVRAPELLAAVRWTLGLLNSPGTLSEGGSVLRLDDINAESPEGQHVVQSAKQILRDLGKADAEAISLADASDTTKIFAQTKFNGDGVVPAESAEDEETRKVLGEIMVCMGGELDRSGKPGVTQAKADKFFAEAKSFADWHAQAQSNKKSILPLGEGTEAAFAAYQVVRDKVNDFFARCRLAAFDARALAALNRHESDYLAVAARDLTITAGEVAHFPLASVEPGRALPLLKGVNPGWASALRDLQTAAIKPILGDKSAISDEEWAALGKALAPYGTWLAAKAGVVVETLGLARVRQILSGKSQEAVAALIAKDKALEPEANAIATVEKLLRFRRDLPTLLNNFISFREFYGNRDWAIFQAGTLYLDGRHCELCVRVEDIAKHGALAGLSYCYLVYCDCVRKAAGEKMTIAAAFTNGDSDFLMPGRNGVFYDRLGRDWDATIVKIVDNPISVRQAFWSPYKRVAKLVESQIEKAAAARDKSVTDKAAAGVDSAGKKLEESKGGAAQAFDVAKFAGIFAAIGLALGVLGAALTSVAKGFFGLALWQMPLATGGVLLLISGPAMLLAYMKLRKRNLGPILDANGWAVNARVRINVPFGASLTKLAQIPPGSHRASRDEFVQKRSFKPYLFLAAVLIYVFLGYSYENGRLHRWTHGRFGKPPPPQTELVKETPPG